MKKIRNINNNICICLDSKNREIIVFGKGVGHGPIQEEIPLNKIDRTFYDINENNYYLLKNINEDILRVSTLIIDYAKNHIDNVINNNSIVTLADHIQFSIERTEKNMNVNLPIMHDIEFLYEKEYDVGLYGLEIIKRKLNKTLPKEEAASIALHIINNESQIIEEGNNDINRNIIDEICEIIENEFAIKINKKNFNYSRFVSHMHYLLKRIESKELIGNDNSKIYETLKNSYPKTYKCACKISNKLKEKLDITLTEDELLYLILHINRLCTREDCNQ